MTQTKYTEAEERVEIRRTALQTVGEVDRGLTLLDLQLKKGMFTGARETVQGLKALMIMQEACIRELNKRNTQLEAGA